MDEAERGNRYRAQPKLITSLPGGTAESDNAESRLKIERRMP